MSSSDRGDVWALLRAESQAWAIEPGRLQGLVAMMARGESVAASSAAMSAPTSPAAAGVAVISIRGPLVRSAGMLADFFGLASYSGIRSSLAQALNDRSVSKILLVVDSPGGAAAGCEECAAEIAAAARIKPMTTYVDGLAASAAYWLGTQAPTITITPSGEVGSVGVLLLHVDVSRALDAAGVTPSFVVSKASPFKVEGNQFEPLGKDARAYQQQAVDKIADKFIGAVAQGRRVSTEKVRRDFGQGRTLMADAARAAGMVDRIGSLRDAIGPGVSHSNAAPAAMTDQQRSAARRHRLHIEAMSPEQRRAAARRRQILIEEQT